MVDNIKIRRIERANMVYESELKQFILVNSPVINKIMKPKILTALEKVIFENYAEGFVDGRDKMFKELKRVKQKETLYYNSLRIMSVGIAGVFIVWLLSGFF